MNSYENLSAKERGGGTGEFVDKKLTFYNNLFSAKHFHKMLYHQTTTNQTKINELKVILCYKYELMRQSKGIIYLTNLRTMFSYFFEEIEFTVNSKLFLVRKGLGVEENLFRKI